MKTNQLIKFFFGFIAIFGSLTSCVEDSQYDTPTIKNPNCDNPNLVATTTLEVVKRIATESFSVPIHRFTSDDIIEGYVVSSDKAGNIFKQVYIQDKPENPKFAVVLNIDEYDTNVKYQVGSKIFIKLKGLAVTNNYGSIEIGVGNGSQLENIPVELARKQILKACEPIVTIVPKKLLISQLTKDHLGMLVEIERIRLKKSDEGFSYAGTTYSGYSRNFETVDNDCFLNGSIILRTSKYADFALTPIPKEQGSIVAILSEYSGTYQLFIRDTKDVKLTTPACVAPQPVTLIDENFEKYALDNGFTVSGLYVLNLTGWSNFSTAGTFKWQLDKLSTNSFATFQATSTPVGNYIGWLVTPQLNMDLQINESLTFNIQKLTVAGSQTELETMYSSNWDGTELGLNTATWINLPLTYPAATSANTLNTFNLSLITGKIHLAFRYNGSSTNRTKWRVDDIKITGMR
ncbi:MAG: DUF5689 domain-containing protein [Flavobacteriaceae bacterium]|nr:DUF5689 domain-containing protein [Flavobacteriaceae bacterium]